MPAIVYTSTLPQDDASRPFSGPLVDNAGTNAFTAQAGANPRTQNGKLVSDAQVYLTVTSGGGATLGTILDGAVQGDNTGSLSGKARGLNIVAAAINSTVAAIQGGVTAVVGSIGVADDEPNYTGGEATIQSRFRALIQAFGFNGQSAVTSNSPGTLIQYARGITAFLYERMPASIGRIAAAGSLSTAMSTEDKAVLDALRTDITALRNMLGTESDVPGPAPLWQLSGSVMARLGALIATNARQDTLADLQEQLAIFDTGSFGAAIAIDAAAPGTLICAPSATVRKTTIKNSSSVRIWLGFDSAVTAGPQGRNIGSIGQHEAWSESYNGAVYGITESGVAYAAPGRYQ